MSEDLKSRQRIWIDAEVHMLPPEWCQLNYFPDAEETVMYDVIYNRDDREYPLSRASMDSIINEMDASHIEKSIIMGMPWRTSKMNWENNDYIRKAVEAYPDRFIGMGMTPAPETDDLVDSVKRISDEYGFKGVKVIPSWQGFSLDDKIFEPAIEEMINKNLILEPHTDHCFMSPEKHDSAYSLFKVAQRYPELKILAPHLAGLLCLYNLYEPMQSILKNIVFVTSVPKTMKMIEFAVQAIGSQNIAFGSDFPFNPSHEQRSMIDVVEGLSISEEDKNNIARGTLMKFLGL